MKTRVLSGTVFAVIMGLLFYLGRLPLLLGLMFFSVLALYEYYKVKGLEKNFLSVCGYIFAVFYIANICFKRLEPIYPISVVLLIHLAYSVAKFGKYDISDLFYQFFGLIYIPVLMSYIYLIRSMEYGVIFIWLLLIASWGCDTFAYFTGVTIGKHKFTPLLSPKKTWEGVAGGIFGAAVCGLLIGIAAGAFNAVNESIIFTSVIACICGSAASIFGDLFASSIKRSFRIKDFGSLIPGHGGVLDRFDSILFAAPVIYFILILTG